MKLTEGQTITQASTEISTLKSKLKREKKLKKEMLEMLEGIKLNGMGHPMRQEALNTLIEKVKAS